MYAHAKCQQQNNAAVVTIIYYSFFSVRTCMYAEQIVNDAQDVSALGTRTQKTTKLR